MLQATDHDGKFGATHDGLGLEIEHDGLGLEIE